LQILVTIPVLPVVPDSPLSSEGNQDDPEGKEISREMAQEPLHALTSIDNILHVPQTDKVIIVDLTNGLFIVDSSLDRKVATIKPFFDLEQYDKIKLRCACLCYDHTRSAYLCMFSMRQTHQHIHFIPLSVTAPSTDLFSEISESKIRAKRIYFNSLWNSFQILDYDDNYYLMEFYNLYYYEKYCLRFKAIDENQQYLEEETEFDEDGTDDRPSDPPSLQYILDLVNGRIGPSE
jgi:hypothetical protein